MSGWTSPQIRMPEGRIERPRYDLPLFGLVCTRHAPGADADGKCPACAEQLAPLPLLPVGPELVGGAGRCPCCSAIWRLGKTDSGNGTTIYRWAELIEIGALVSDPRR